VNCIAFIPAKGNSKGIPRKNMRSLAGKPLIYYSIKAALGASKIKHVFVTTDDEEIALYSKRFGAGVIMRSSQLSNEDVTLDPVIADALFQSEKILGENMDLILTLQPTSPLVLPQDINGILQEFVKNKGDTLISAIEDKHLRWHKSGSKITPLYKKRVNRQALPDEYKETGALLLCTRDQLTKGSRIGEKTDLYIMEKSRSIDIDNIFDFSVCENILKQKNITEPFLETQQ